MTTRTPKKMYFEISYPESDGMPLTHRSQEACIQATTLYMEMTVEGRKAIESGRSGPGLKHLERADFIKKMEELFSACLYTLEQHQAAHKNNVALLRAARSRIEELERIFEEI